MRSATWAVRESRASLKQAETGRMTPPAPSLIPVDDYIDMAAAENELIREQEAEQLRMYMDRSAESLSLADKTLKASTVFEDENGVVAKSLVAMLSSPARERRASGPTNISLTPGLLESYRRSKALKIQDKLRPSANQMLEPLTEAQMFDFGETDYLAEAADAVRKDRAKKLEEKDQLAAEALEREREAHDALKVWRQCEAEQLELHSRNLVDGRIESRWQQDNQNHRALAMEKRMQDIAAQVYERDEAEQRERERIANLIRNSHLRVQRDAVELDEDVSRLEITADEHREFQKHCERFHTSLFQPTIVGDH